MSCKNGSPILPFQKYLEVTGRYYNIASGDTFSQYEFESNWIWCHKFESEQTTQGWLGINISLEQAFTENMYMIVWIIVGMNLFQKLFTVCYSYSSLKQKTSNNTQNHPLTAPSALRIDKFHQIEKINQ